MFVVFYKYKVTKKKRTSQAQNILHFSIGKTLLGNAMK